MKSAAERASANVTQRRTDRSARRRRTILDAALEEFGSRGFTATRIDDVARRAGVAKGTIYLYFADKEALFQELVRGLVVPQVARLENLPPSPGSTRDIVEAFFERIVSDVLETPRRDLLRLMIAEGHRFPQLAEFYYREVVERAIAALRAMLAPARARGELPNDAILRFPQLLVAPLMLALIWHGLFERLSPLDTRALIRAHLDLVFGEGGER